MENSVIERLDLGRLVNFGAHKNEAIHRWYCYRHSFSLDLVKELTTHFGLNRECTVLDPFCGSGTTLLGCQELGIASEGVDKLPFSVFVSNVKTRKYRQRDLLRGFEELSFGRQSSDVEPYLEVPVIRKAFTPEVLAAVLGLRDEIRSLDVPAKIRDFLLLCWYGILEGASQTIKDGAFLRVIEKCVAPGDIPHLFTQRFQLMISDVSELPRPTAKAWEGDSRCLPSKLLLSPYDAVITSPPYPNRHDYTRIYALELLLGGGVKDNESLKKLRYQTLRSHVEARRAYTPIGYREPHRLRQILDHIKARETYDQRNIAMLQGYFEDMFLVLQQIFVQCKAGAKAALVVSDVRFSGVTVPVGDLLLELGTTIGFVAPETWVLRYRGNTPQQLRAFSKERTLESVVMLRKPD